MTAATAGRYRQIIARFPRLRVVVAGDLIADEFIYGRVERVSREAPVLILRYDATEVVPGGAGNAASNAAALGAAVDVVGIVGKDVAGRRMLGALPPRARTGAVRRVASYVTPVKTRILAGGVHSAKQQVVRIDRAGGSPTACDGASCRNGVGPRHGSRQRDHHFRLRERPDHAGPVAPGHRRARRRRRPSRSWIRDTRSATSPA